MDADGNAILGVDKTTGVDSCMVCCFIALANNEIDLAWRTGETGDNFFIAET